MSGPLQILLMVGPLALYLSLIGAWQAGRGPRVIPGPVDSALLGVALISLVGFGPIGRALGTGPVGWVLTFGHVRGLSARPALLACLTLGWMLLAAGSRRRLAIYNVEADALRRAVRAAVEAAPGDFVPTLHSFEDRQARRSLTVELAPRYRTAEVVAAGPGADALIAAIEPALRRHFRGQAGRDIPLARFWFSLSSLAVTAPMAAYLLSRPLTRAALRALIERLRGG